jgi:threonine aldolase
MASNGNPAWNFGSDNIAPVAPEIFAALAAANEGNVDSYGADAWSARLNERFSAFFGRDVTVFPLATGTAANALALSLLAPPYGAVLCTDIAHIDNDECNAVEFFTGGAKLLGLPTDDGRLDAAQLAGPVAQAAAMGVHNAQPYAVSLTQATEWGTVYGLGALGAITAAARGHGLGVHMDGARFANAVVSLGCAPGAMVAGVDVLSFGATKNGAMAAEAVVIFDPARAAGFAQRRKRSAQLWSKQRYLSAQLLALLENDLWHRHASHANAAAGRLAAGLGNLPGVRLLLPVEANELFVALPEAMVARLEAAGFGFYRWRTPGVTAGADPVIRLVTSYATPAEAVEALLGAALGNY